MCPLFSGGKQSPEPLPSSSGCVCPGGLPFPSPPSLGAVSTCGKFATLVEFFNKENSRVIHLCTQSNTSPTRDVMACASSKPDAVRGPSRDYTSAWLPGSFINEVRLMGSYNLPAICCYLITFFFSNLSGSWVYESLETNEIALCPCLSISLFQLIFR